MALFKTFFLTLFLFFMTACPGAEGLVDEGTSQNKTQLSTGGSEVTEIDLSGATSPILDAYSQSSFSPYVYFHKGENKIMIDYNFLPSGSDIDSIRKVIEIPCTQDVAGDDKLSVSLSAPLNDAPCEDGVTVDVSDATFTVAGMEFGFSETLDVFVFDFDVLVTRNGFVDAVDQQALKPTFDRANLGTLSDLIEQKRVR